MNSEKTTDFNINLNRASFAGEYKKSDEFLELILCDNYLVR